MVLKPCSTVPSGSWQSHLDIAGIAGIILQYHHIIVLTTLQQSGIYATESRIYQELTLGPCLEILGYGIVETVIVLLVFDAQGEVLARHTRCPYHHCLQAASSQKNSGAHTFTVVGSSITSMNFGSLQCIRSRLSA